MFSTKSASLGDTFRAAVFAFFIGRAVIDPAHEPELSTLLFISLEFGSEMTAGGLVKRGETYRLLRVGAVGFTVISVPVRQP